MATKQHRHIDLKGKVTELPPIEISGEELEIEAAEKTIAELSKLADKDIKVPQVAKFLKALAKLRR